jgi:chromosome segregation ATPase
MYASKFRNAFIVMVAMSMLPHAFAADKKPDPSRELARRMQQANRKLEQEKAQLVTEKTEVETRLKDAEGKLGDAQGHAASANRRAAQLSKDLETVHAEKDALGVKLGETEKKLTETTEQLDKETGERKRLEGVAAQQKASLGQCGSLNAKMHSEGLSLLEKYKTKGCFDAALQAEPFTGLKQVEIENFVEDSRDKLDANKFEPRANR